jgi:hypothetical protein
LHCPQPLVVLLLDLQEVLQGADLVFQGRNHLLVFLMLIDVVIEFSVQFLVRIGHHLAKSAPFIDFLIDLGDVIQFIGARHHHHIGDA